MREPQQQDAGSSSVRGWPKGGAEPQMQSAADTQRWLDRHNVVGDSAHITELLRGVPFN